MIEFNKKNCIS